MSLKYSLESYGMQRWTIHLEGGPKRVNHAAVSICNSYGERIFSFGGYCSGEDYETTRPMDVHVLDVVSLRWKRLPIPAPDDVQYQCIPYQRYGHTAVAVGDCAYIWGGRNDKDGACNILYCFDSNALAWSCPPVNGCKPGARDGHSACVINNKMYIFGGYEEEIDRFSNQVQALDFASFTWCNIITKGVPAIWRDFHSATAIGNIMYVFGGRSDVSGEMFSNREIYCNKIQMFDTVTNTWTQPNTSGVAPIGRRSHSAFVYKGFLYVFGGFNGSHHLHFRDIFRFDPVHNHWTMVKVKGKGPCPRRRQCCCVIGSRVFLFGGTSPINHAFSPVLVMEENQRELEDMDLYDHSDLHVLDFAPTLKMLCELVVLEHKLDTSLLPLDIRWELNVMTTNNSITKPSNSTG